MMAETRRERRRRRRMRRMLEYAREWSRESERTGDARLVGGDPRMRQERVVFFGAICTVCFHRKKAS